MNLATGIFGALIFFFLWRGYQKGFIGSITRIVSWLVAYPAAIFLTKPIAQLVFKHSNFDGMIVYFVVGSLIFLIVSLSVSKLLNYRSHDDKEDKEKSQASKIAGATVGGLVGGVLGLLAVYAIGVSKTPSAESSRNNDQADVNAQEIFYSPPDNQNINQDINQNLNQLSKATHRHDESLIDMSAKKLVSNVAAAVVDLTLKDQTTTNLTKAFAEDPQSMLGHIQQLSNDGQIKNLLADTKIQEILSKGDAAALSNNQDFQNLIRNPDMQAILENAGTDKTGKTSSVLTAEKMIAAWARTSAIKNDPRVIAIISDPEFQQQLNSTNKLPLLTNPKLKILTALIFSNQATTENETAPTNSKPGDNNTKSNHYKVTDITEGLKQKQAEPALEKNTTQTEEKIEKQIYRWTDESGKVHYSDKPTKD